MMDFRGDNLDTKFTVRANLGTPFFHVISIFLSGNELIFLRKVKILWEKCGSKTSP